MGLPHIGEIILVGFNFAPVGWLTCQGQLLAIADYDPLFNLIGTTYGGDGQNTFALPNLSGRVAVSQGQGPGLQNYQFGEMAGVNTVTLLTTQIPSHTHALDSNSMFASIRCRNAAGNQRTPVGNVPAIEGAGTTMTYSDVAPDALMRDQSATVSGNLATITGGAAGGTQPHDNMQPSLAMNYCICFEGAFPQPS